MHSSFRVEVEEFGGVTVVGLDPAAGQGSAFPDPGIRSGGLDLDDPGLYLCIMDVHTSLLLDL